MNEICNVCDGAGKILVKHSNIEQKREDLPRFEYIQCYLCKGKGFIKINVVNK